MSRADPSDLVSIDDAVAGDESAGGDPVVFQAVDDGVAAVDLVNRSRYSLATTADVDPTPVATDAFVYPVDAAVEIRTDRVTTRSDVPAIYIRDADWNMVVETDPPTDRTFPPAEYYLEICAPIKLFAHVEGAMTITATTGGKQIDFHTERRVELGAFSKHDRPAATVTTTGEPRDVMAAVSTFGSVLKTTSPERSFPNQRGHPPALALGEELSIPDGLAPPDTGVTIEVPPELRYVYPVAPLAYYLGAEVVPGDQARLVTDDGFVHDLAPDGQFEREVERVLKGTFLLDCVTRTEGLYTLDLAERQAVEPAVDLDFAALYDRPLADRLKAYLDVPYAVLEPHVPDWKLTADVSATAATVETLPFVVDDLAVVRTDAAGRSVSPEPSGDGETSDAASAVDSLLRSSREAVAAPTPSTVDVPSAGSLEHTWIGDGAATGASKAMAAAYRNRLDRDEVEGDIGVTVVCNDTAMLDEHTAVDDVYGTGEAAPIDVSIEEGLETDELRAVLASDVEFLHYIGHIDERGFECEDGWLDAGTLETTGVDTFLLNACTSYEQGTALIEAGAIGGIVTLARVFNEPAVRFGSTVARLLDAGYPLRPATNIARQSCYSSRDYIVVGDGSATAVTRADCVPNLYKVQRDGDAFRLEIVSYLSVNGGMGDIITPHLPGVDRYYLGAGSIDTFRVSGAELDTFLHLDEIPILYEGELHWPDEFAVGDR